MTSDTKQVAIYGSGGHGREIAWLLESCNLVGQASFQVVCFVDDDATNHGKLINDIPVVGLATARERFPRAHIVGGIGMPKPREITMNKAGAVGFEFATVIHPRVEMSRWLELAEGVVICAGTILTTNIRLGRHVQINRSCTIGHDVVMDDYATLAPGANISGTVHIGKRAYIGAGAVVINGKPGAPIVIGEDAVIGAGACVTKSVAARATVVGVPARLLQKSV